MGIWASIATVLLSGVVAALVSFILNATKEEVLFRQRKAEDLYREFVLFDKLLCSGYFMRLTYLSGKITKDQLNDSVLEDKGNPARDSYDKVEMIISFYFPDLLPLWANYLSARDQINALVFEAERERAKKAEFQKALFALSQPSDLLKGAIIEQGQRYADFNLLQRALRFR